MRSGRSLGTDGPVAEGMASGVTCLVSSGLSAVTACLISSRLSAVVDARFKTGSCTAWLAASMISASHRPEALAASSASHSSSALCMICSSGVSARHLCALGALLPSSTSGSRCSPASTQGHGCATTSSRNASHQADVLVRAAQRKAKKVSVCFIMQLEAGTSTRDDQVPNGKEARELSPRTPRSNVLAQLARSSLSCRPGFIIH